MTGHDEAVDVVVLGDGTILGAIRFAAGATTGGIAFGFGLAHVPANGVPAPRVPQPVITFTTQSDNPRSMLVQTDGKIVVVGQSANLGTNPDMAIARFNDSGLALDPSFGTAGKLTVDFFGGRDGAEAVVQQPDGKLWSEGSREVGRRPCSLQRGSRRDQPQRNREGVDAVGEGVSSGSGSRPSRPG